MKKAEERWGAGVVEQVSLDLQVAFPESKGFSPSNLWRMKQWYVFYSEAAEKLAQVVRALQYVDIKDNTKLAQVVRKIEQPQVVGEFRENGMPFPTLFSLVPWGHHCAVIAKSKTVEEALFYVNKTISEGWSRNTLMNCIKADLYHTSGGAITNFSTQLPSSQGALAQAITKDTYDFGFVSLAQGYQEEELETELEKNLTRFLLELGTGFAYMGR